MEQSVIVVDDAYHDPHETRRTALSLPYRDAPGALGYPGRISHSPPTVDELRCVATAAADESPPGDARASSGTFHLWTAADGDAGGMYAHDPEHYRWMGIIDLTPPAQGIGTLGLYRHIETGSEGLMAGSRYAAQNRRATADAADPEQWERVASITTAFNRLVLFRPWLWHSMPRPAGGGAQDTRLMRILMIRSPAGEQTGPSATSLRAR